MEATSTESAPIKRKGIAKVFHDLLHRRRRFRQLFGALFVFLLTFAGRPTLTLLIAGAVFCVLGIAVRMWASGCVKKNRVLATSGPYAFVRHPLYVGNILICAGFCLASALWWSVPLGLVLLALFYPPAIRYEDQKLRGLFPDQWDDWGQVTPALIPRLGAWSKAKGAEWSFRLSLFKNGEPVYAVIMVTCMAFLWART